MWCPCPSINAWNGFSSRIGIPGIPLGPYKCWDKEEVARNGRGNGGPTGEGDEVIRWLGVEKEVFRALDVWRFWGVAWGEDGWDDAARSGVGCSVEVAPWLGGCERQWSK